jgi:glycosyltransferase involved in cell wall biosynthesis
MKVLIDGRRFESALLRHTDRYTSALITHLAQRGLAVYLLYDASTVASVASLQSGNIGNLPVRGRVGFLREQMYLPMLLGRGNYDLLHIPTEETTAPYFSPCPVVMTFLSPAKRQDHAKPAENAVAPFAGVRRRIRSGSVDHIIATSEYCRRHVVSALAVPPDRISVIPFAGIEGCGSAEETSGTREALGQLGVRAPYLLNAGGYESEEDAKLLLAAFAEVRQGQAGLQLVLTGMNMPSVHLLEHAQMLGLTVDEEVLFLFDVGEAMQVLYDGAELALSVAADRVCQPWILQAMARGLQVVCTATGCAAEMVGCAGKVIPRPDPHDAARTTMFLLSSGTKAQRRAAARQQAERFSWEKIVDETIAVYEVVVSQRKGRAMDRNPIYRRPPLRNDRGADT